ncbi:hypothetical protein B1K54_35360 [Streptomyces sp. fd1-xmd]|nr:hypothetical protein B1K54_35360 [Streptomyces sp. fd1-xmd]
MNRPRRSSAAVDALSVPRAVMDHALDRILSKGEYDAVRGLSTTGGLRIGTCRRPSPPAA